MARFTKDRALLFPFRADSIINAFTRFGFSSVPYPKAQHSASISMASVSSDAAQSSRSATAIVSFLFIPSPFIILIASSLLASVCPCSVDFCSSSAIWVLVLFFGGILSDWRTRQMIQSINFELETIHFDDRFKPLFFVFF